MRKIHILKCQFSRKTNKLLEFFQRAHIILLIKQHTCKVSTLRLHKKNYKDSHIEKGESHLNTVFTPWNQAQMKQNLFSWNS